MEFNEKTTEDEKRLQPIETIEKKLKELEMTEEQYQIYLQFKILKRLERIVKLLEERG